MRSMHCYSTAINMHSCSSDCQLKLVTCLQRRLLGREGQHAVPMLGEHALLARGHHADGQMLPILNAIHQIQDDVNLTLCIEQTLAMPLPCFPQLYNLRTLSVPTCAPQYCMLACKVK